MRRLIYIALVLGAFFTDGLSQQVPLYSQYMLNGFLLNPAVAGSEGYTAVNLTAREQWIGLQNGPGTYALSFQTRILRKSYIARENSILKNQQEDLRGGNVGVGGYFFKDRNGAVERTGFKGTYAYHISFPESQLSFGLTFAAYQYGLNEDLIRFADPGDDLWLGAKKSVFIPDADAGVYFTTEKYWAGFSVDQLFESTLKIGDSGYARYVMERNYYIMGGYDFEVKPTITISPSTLIKIAENGKLQADINGKIYIQQTYWGGLTYRTGHAVIVMAGISIDKFIFGYAFDIGLNSIMKHSYGTHEFTFIVKFGDNARRRRWLSRF